MLRLVVLFSIALFAPLPVQGGGFGTNDFLCEIRVAHAPKGEGCVVNRDVNAAGQSNALVVDSSPPTIYLLKRGAAATGACSASSVGACVPLHGAAQSYGDFCSVNKSTDIGMPCASSDPVWRYAPDPVRATGSALRLLEVADGLEANDWEVIAARDYFAYLSRPAFRRTVRFLGTTGASSTIEVRAELAVRDTISQVVTALADNGISLADLRSFGNDGALLIKRAAVEEYFPPPVDCPAPCVGQPLRDLASFESEIKRLGDLADVENLPLADPARVRNLLIERLLLGPAPVPDLDAELETFGAVQPPQLLLFDRVP